MHQVGGKRQSAQHGKESGQDGVTNSCLFSLLVIKHNDALRIFCVPGFSAIFFVFLFLIQLQNSSFNLLYAYFNVIFPLCGIAVFKT